MGLLVSATRLPVFDADCHLYEAEDAPTHYLPSSFADQLGDLNPTGMERIMSTNMFELLDLPRPGSAP